MDKFLESFTSVLDNWGELVEIVLNTFSLLCIVGGIVISLIKAVGYRKHFPGDHPLHTRFRMLFGGWLVVALEFQLAADIVGTIISPTTAHLVELGAVAVIRTFLNYFLIQELKEQKETEDNRSKKDKQQNLRLLND